MKNFTDVGTLWFDKTEYPGDLLNVSVSKEGGEVHCIGKKIVQNSPGFAAPKSVKSEAGEDATVVTADFECGLSVRECFEFFKTTGAIRQINTIRNNSDENIGIDLLASAINLSTAGVLPWNHADRYRIHYCVSTWCGEAQWKHASFEQLGMCRARGDAPSSIERFLLRSEGSWSTGSYYPMIVIEDMERGRSYYFENECGNNWEIEISKHLDYITVNIDTANFNHDCWRTVLAPGQEYTSTPAVYGMVEGGFEEAAAALNAYKRETSLVKWNDGHALLIYNNYMGGTWGSPDARIMDMIDAAADAGCEVFCIDAGWFRVKGTDMFSVLGDYDYKDEIFAPYTFKQIVDHMKDKGMIPGVWFEFEAVTDVAQAYKIKDGVCKRNGHILSGKRAFLDFSNEEVCSWIEGYVKKVYDLGIRYIKNDYNNSTGMGIGDSDYNENAKKAMRAFYAFIDRLYERFPGLIIENCGSGGMRSDNMTLSHFAIQSTSDQEYYYKNPSIIMGSSAIMPPEKLGAWAYPIFETYMELSEKDQDAVRKSVSDRCKNGEETIFSMVNGNMGAMYMSGRIDWADELNTSLIHEGAKMYLENRDFIAEARPIYPTGMIGAGESGIASMGYTDGNRILLAVWKICESYTNFVIDLSKYVSEESTLSMVYPSDRPGCKYFFSKSTGRLTLTLEGADNMARLFEIKL